jgi:hypothetical protein
MEKDIMNLIYNLYEIVILPLIYIFGIYISKKGPSKDKVFNKGVLIFFSILLIERLYNTLFPFILKKYLNTIIKADPRFFFHVKSIPDMLLYLSAFVVLVVTLYKSMRAEE